MKHIKKLCFLLSMLMLLPLFLSAQENSNQPTRHFAPWLGLNYNVHSMSYSLREYDIPFRDNGNYPGIEFGFSILPSKEQGWYWEYRNTFLGELALYGIEDALDIQEGIFTEVVNQTVNNGFLGRLDFGKNIISSGNRMLQAGFVISDKVVFGTEVYPPYHTAGPESYDASGFHFTPGAYASFSALDKHKGVFSLRFALTQSLFNLHQFGESAIENYVLPLFSELDLKYQMPGGIYFRAGGLLLSSFTGVPADARISFGAGYRF